MAEKRSRLKIRDDGLREILTDFRGYIAFVELTAVCVRCVCAILVNDAANLFELGVLRANRKLRMDQLCVPLVCLICWRDVHFLD